MKLKIYITNPEGFVNRNYNWAFGAYPANFDYVYDKHHEIAEIDVDISADIEKLRKEALNELAEQEDAVTAKYAEAMEHLKVRKNQLLALDYRPEEPVDLPDDDIPF